MTEFAVPKSEFGSTPEDLSAFNQAIDNVKNHNGQFSMDELVARVGIDWGKEAAHRFQELTGGDAGEEQTEQVVDYVNGDTDGVLFNEEESLARSIVGLENAAIFTATGLGLSPLRAEGTIAGPNGEGSFGKVHLQVTDGGKFSHFLLAIDPENVNVTLQESVTEVVESVVKEMIDAITDESDEHAQRSAAETLAYSKGIVLGLEHIGLAESEVARQLSNIGQHVEQGDVQEYVKAGKLQLLESSESQVFGPANWQQNASADFLLSQWNSVLDVIETVAKNPNPNAKDLFSRLVASAQESLDYAKADWIKLKADNYGGEDYGKGFDEVFETVGLELGMIAPSHDKS